MSDKQTASMKKVAEQLRLAISGRDRQKADDILRSGLANAPDEFVGILRKNGVFRFNRYAFQTDIITPLVEKALCSGGSDLSARSQVYLKSVLALSELSPAVAGRLKHIRMFVNPGHLKSFLVTIDLLFRRMHSKIFTGRISSWRNYGIEELADGFSYYFSLLREKSLIRVADINKIMESRIDSEFYLEKLATFASIVRFREVEMEIEAFPYCAETSNMETMVQAVSPDFEKSIRWGYITSEEHRNANFARSTKEGKASLKDLAIRFVDNLGNELFEILPAPYSRIRIHIPTIKNLAAAFFDNRFFAEDEAFIIDAMTSLFLTYEQLLAIPIQNSITLIDLLKFRRICVFLQAALDEFCKRKGLLGSPVYYRSLVAHFNDSQIIEWISELIGIKDPKSLIGVLCASEEKTAVFDLQYTPLMKLAGHYLIPIGVVANNNIMRNALQQSRFRFDSGSKMDPVGDVLVGIFHNVRANAKARIKIRYNGVEVEIDVLAKIDANVFAFECKNSLHPCNVYELRQSYDYILKAAGQLDRIKRFFSDLEFRHRLSEAVGFDVTACASLTTCIATGNRMFNGHREAGHAVRNVYELETFIGGGKLSIMPFPKNPDFPDGPHVRLRVRSWAGEKLSATDLIRYIEHDTWHTDALRAMSPYEEVTTYGRHTLRIKSFALDLMTYRDLVRQHSDVSVDELSTNPSKI